MARNRKLRSAAARFGPALKAFLLCLLIGGSGVGYVWQKDQIIRLDRRIKQNEVQLTATQDRNDSLRKQLNGMRTLQSMQQRIKDLGLIEPQPSQKWRLLEPVGEPVPALAPPPSATPFSKQIAHAGR
jgi:type VI protein secretion system component VasK